MVHALPSRAFAPLAGAIRQHRLPFVGRRRCHRLPTEVSLRLLALRPAIVRGNASEIMALAGESGAAGKGVDSTRGSEAARDAARALAASTGSVVAVTGAVDYVTDGTRMTGIANGDPMLSRVTGTAAATALCGAFLGAGLARSTRRSPALP
jgi:hydroxyethylthiazole kinase